MSTKNGVNLKKSDFNIKRHYYIYEDDGCFAFDEMENPQAPIHYVVAPKKHISTLCDATVEDEKVLGHLLIVAKNMAISRGLHKTGYHVIVDEDHRPHVRKLKAVHVFGRALQHMIWPLGPGARL